MKAKSFSLLTLTTAIAFCFSACNSPSSRSGSETGDTSATEDLMNTESEAKTAVATISPLGENGISGTVTFTEENGEVKMVANITSPGSGTHAIHIHENGDCSAPDGSSAGGHWNPTNEDHGKWGEEPFHRGDIGNIEVGDDGAGSLELTTDLWCLDCPDSVKNIVGRAIIVHETHDDFHTQPTGNAGGRMGCAVIEMQ
ncbi:MAG: superoxide dismutase family protein [Solitalea sp.]